MITDELLQVLQPAGAFSTLQLSLRDRCARIIQRTSLYEVFAGFRNRRAYEKWLALGRRGSTPHLAKADVIRSVARDFELTTLVETGTYFGAMIDAVKGSFQRIFTIELDPALHSRAVNKFRNDTRIACFQGDSGAVIVAVLRDLTEPAVFWLDAHYSGGITARGQVDSPIVSELRSVLTHPLAGRHAILIDDARAFDGTQGYPTMNSLKSLLRELGSMHRVEAREDIIRLLP